MKRLPLAALCALAFVTPAVLPLGGCQGGAFAAFDPQAAAMAALSEAIKQQVRSYLGGMEGVVRELTAVQDLNSAIAAVDKVKPYYNDVQKAWPELKKISGKDLENVRIAFGPELDKLAGDFDGQAERLSGSGAIGTILKSVLDKVKPFTAK